MLQPLLLDSFDELDHMGTLFRIFNSHTLFPTNTVLPVSPYYPGLELATAAAKWITGLPLVIDQLIVLSIVRVVLVLGLFLIVERICRSSRAGGIGVLIYAASPQFYGFDAQYAYETIGLAFAVGAVYLVFFSVDAPKPRMGKAFILALGAVCAVVISHHVTGWLTVGFLVVWVVGMYLTTHPLRHRRRSGRWPYGAPRPAAADTEGVEDLDPAASLALSDVLPVARDVPALGEDPFRARRRTQTGIVGVATGVGIVVGGAWTLFVFHLLTPYLGPIFSDAAAEIRVALGNGHGDRALFKSSSGGTSPHWEIALILLAAAVWCLILLPALYGVIFKRSVRGGGLRWIPAVIVATYPLSVLANVSSSSKLVAERATTFIFFGMAIVIGAWLAKRIARERGLLERFGTLLVATIIFLGSLLFGIGPLVSLLPGPYQVGADSLSYGSPSFAVANWADTHLPAGSNVAADKDNGVLLNAIGGVNAVTAESGLVNPELLYFDRSLSLYDIYLIRKADIRYLVVDDRLATGRPLYGTYIADGEPPSRLTLPQLTKLNSYSFIKRIYDNGPIQVFDLTQLLPPSERAAPAGPPSGSWGLNPGIFVLALVVGMLWLLRLRRHWSKVPDAAHLACSAPWWARWSSASSARSHPDHACPAGGDRRRRPRHPPRAEPPATELAPAPLGRRATANLATDHRRWRNGNAGAGANEDGGGPAASAHVASENGGVPGRGTPKPVPLSTPGLAGHGGDQVAIGSTFYERREIKDILAYLHVLADPADVASLRRVLNVPKRGIGPKSYSRLVSWARHQHIPLRDALDRAEDAGFRAQALEGAQQLSELLAELEPLVGTTSPQDLIEQVVERTGYRTWLARGRDAEADGRLDNLDEMVERAGAFDDLDELFDAVARDIESPGSEPAPASISEGAPDQAVVATPGPTAEAKSHPDGAVTSPAPSDRDPATRRTRRRRVQIALGGLGVVLFVVGASVATGAAAKDWTPPAELSISTSTTDDSVAQVQLGSAGPVAARLEITNGGRTLWHKSLARTAASQNVALPTRYLHKGSCVDLVTGGRTLRWVDGWVSTVPKPKPTSSR